MAPTGGSVSSSGSSAAPSDGITGGSATGGASSIYPTYQPVTSITPDEPAVGDGMALFLNYPKDPKKFVSQAPGNGGDVSAFVSLNGATAPAKGPRWDAANKRLNVNLSLNMVADDYNAKLATLVAGGDFPDIVQLMDGAVANLPGLLESKFTDLTPYLGGDAVKDYPGLANIPHASWRSCVYDGKLFAVPQSRGLLLNGDLVRPDVLAKRGLPTTVKTGEDFQALCKELTNERKNQWAVAYGPGVILMMQMRYGVPNGWQVDNGEFTSAYETPQMKEALSATNAMWKSGVMNPDSWTPQLTSVWASFINGSVPIFPGINWGNAPAAQVLAASKNEPAIDVDIWGPAGAGGHTPKYWTGPGYWGYSGIPKAKPDRVKELLRVMDYLASPFGSEEWIFVEDGLPGTDYTMQGTNPVEKDSVVDKIPLKSIASPPITLYRAGQDAIMKRVYAFQTEWLAAPYETQDPSIGLASATLLQKGPSLTKAIQSAVTDVAQGRKSLSDWESAVKTWQSAGGAAAKKELSQAWQAANG
jgi:putative aldouronate transport system substrate-binding protein